MLGVWVEIHLTHSMPVFWEHPQHCGGSRKIAPDSSLLQASSVQVHDPYDGAIWTSRAVCRGYWDVGRRQWVPVSDRAARAVFMNGKVKAELQASSSCKGRRGAEPRLNNKVMPQIRFSSCNLCNCLRWELQRPWWEGEGFHAVPALQLAAARAFLAGGCKGTAYALQSSNWTKSLLRQSLPVSRRHLPGSAACWAVAVSLGRAWATPRDVTGAQRSLVHCAVCNAAFKEAIQGLQKASPKSLNPLLCSDSFICQRRH